jgi:hypothetical protein
MMLPSKLTWSAVAFVLVGNVANVGCGPRTRFDGTTFHKRDVNYRIGRLSPEWQRVRMEGNDLAFYRSGYGTMIATARCEGYEDVPPHVLLNQLLFGTTDRAYLTDEEVTLDGRGALHAITEAELDGVPVRLETYLLVRSGCVFDLDYVSDLSAPGIDEFTRFVRDFHVESVTHD